MSNVTLIMNPDCDTPMSLRNSWLRVDWYNADEGWNGDYDPEDPDDVNLLRFDVYVMREPEPWDDSDDGWRAVDDASYCTQMPANTKPEILERALRRLFAEYEDALESDHDCSVKKLGESLSWISPDDFR